MHNIMPPYKHNVVTYSSNNYAVFNDLNMLTLSIPIRKLMKYFSHSSVC